MTDVSVNKGLEGIVADVSAISMVNPESNSLLYAGYPVDGLADRCSFEEIAYLLWHGQLPHEEELDEFCHHERRMRRLSPSVLNLLEHVPARSHPMDVVRTAVSVIGMDEPTAMGTQPAEIRNAGLRVLASLPTALAAFWRTRKGREPIPPRRELGYVENFFHMCFGEIPEQEVLDAFEASLILYAEHGFNASTFTARVIGSTQSDLHSALTGAVAALKGPLHGGANEAVMHMLLEIGEPSHANSWLDSAFATKRKIMGFGHRVYRNGDSRVPTMRRHAQRLAELRGESRLWAICEIVERRMIAEKGIHPNLDFPSGLAYHLMGFDVDLFTPFFVMARTTGWVAHFIEQATHNRLIRPLCRYVGPDERTVPNGLRERVRSKGEDSPQRPLSAAEAAWQRGVWSSAVYGE